MSYSKGYIAWVQKSSRGGYQYYGGGFRQGKKLTNREKGQFMTLNQEIRKKILTWSPLVGK